MELLEANIKLWLSGKEGNVELLLSTLHDVRLNVIINHLLYVSNPYHYVLVNWKFNLFFVLNYQILWPNCGWYPIPLTNLYESSHVKKAYQKARLCLHPDKLQQRGATLLQKYVAERIFPILQVNCCIKFIMCLILC